MIKAIETKYKGYRFRSRLEARWAVFFDSLGVKWEYEKEGYDLGGRKYLPDFWLPEWNTWLEIKPDLSDESTIKAIENMLVLKHDSIKGDRDNLISVNALVICGAPGLTRLGLDKNRLWTLKEGYAILNPIAVYGDSNSHTLRPVPGKELQKRFFLGEKGNGRPIRISVDISTFAMVDGGNILDVWPLYITEYEVDADEFDHTDGEDGEFWRSINHAMGGIDTIHVAPTYPCGTMQRLYKGKGVKYDTANLRMGYTAARSARFEHGECG